MSYFPIKVKLANTGEEYVVDHPNNLPSNMAFTVLEVSTTNTGSNEHAC